MTVAACDIAPTGGRAGSLMARRQRIVRRLREGASLRTLRSEFGLHHMTLMEELKAIRREYPDLELPRAPKAATLMVTDASLAMRKRLGDMLWHYRDNGGTPRYRSEVSEAIGLPCGDQGAAETAPYAYDWSLSQIERLAVALGKPFPVLLAEISAPGAGR